MYTARVCPDGVGARMQQYDAELAEAVRRRILLPACDAIETHLRLEHHASLVRLPSTQHHSQSLAAACRSLNQWS